MPSIKSILNRPGFRLLSLLILGVTAGLAFLSCEREYLNPFDPRSPDYAGEEWSRDEDGNGIADSVEIYAPGCTDAPGSCLSLARKAANEIRLAGETSVKIVSQDGPENRFAVKVLPRDTTVRVMSLTSSPSGKPGGRFSLGTPPIPPIPPIPWKAGTPP